MDLAWLILGICAFGGFFVFVLLRHWQNLLRSHSRAIQELFLRVQGLEAIEDPEFRRRLGDSAPSPLQQVYTFTFRVSERFWSAVAAASAEEMEFVGSHGKFLGSIKIEKWREHWVATIYELLPQSKSAAWQTRSVDIYPTSADAQEPVVLWELPLAPADADSHEAGETIELCVDAKALLLRGRYGRFAALADKRRPETAPESIFFIVPFDEAQIAAYRKSDSAPPEGSEAAGNAASSWMAVYEYQDEQRGLEWRLCVRDLLRKAEWERWKVLEPWARQAASSG